MSAAISSSVRLSKCLGGSLVSVSGRDKDEAEEIEAVPVRFGPPTLMSLSTGSKIGDGGAELLVELSPSEATWPPSSSPEG